MLLFMIITFIFRSNSAAALVKELEIWMDGLQKWFQDLSSACNVRD